MTDHEALRAWAYLSAVAEPPCRELAALVAAAGAVEAAQRVRRGAVSPALAERTAARRELDTATTDLEMLDRRGGRLVTPDDEEWPRLAFASFAGADLRAKPTGIAPLALWVIGPQRLDEIQFGGVKGAELGIAGQQLGELWCLLVAIAGQEHPQVLDRRTRAGVIEVDDVCHAIQHQYVARMKITMQPQFAWRAGPLMAMADALEGGGTDAFIGGADVGGNEIGGEQIVA